MAAGVVTVAVLLVVLVTAASGVKLNSRRSDLLPADCGRRLVQPGHVSRPLIIGDGNTTAYYGQFPWQARIEVYKRKVRGYVHQCGGIIITRRHVLTAAHCVDHVALNSIVVRVGDQRFGSRDGAEQEFGVSSIRVHTQFGHHTAYANDISLLMLKVPRGEGIAFGRFVQPACLPEADAKYPVHTECEVSGWGRTGNSAPISEVLRGVTVPLVSDAFCSAPEVHEKRFVTGRMFCAGLVISGPDSCGGDSGGPLVCRDPADDRFVAYGIVSSGDPLGCGRLPGLYTKVSGFVSWLLPRLQLDLAEYLITRPTGATTPGQVDCGRSGFSPPADVGAAYARNMSDFPWLVIVYRADLFVGIGAIISDRWIMSAAVFNLLNVSHTVELGVLDLRIEEPKMTFDVDRVVLHPQYSQPKELFYNIILFRTATPIPLNMGLQPICLPGLTETFEFTTDQTIVAAGWGAPTLVGHHSRLKWTKMKVVDDAECKQISPSLNTSLASETFCIQYERQVKTFRCALNVLDHGSPLMTEVLVNGVRRWYAVGLSEASRIRCSPPSLFRIAALKYSAAWILRVLSED